MTDPPDEVEQALAAARRAEEQGQTAQAELWLERALLLQPENAQARFEWARMLLLRGETESGLALLQSLEQDPRTPLTQRQRLQELIRSLDNRQKSAINQAPSTAPDKPSAREPSPGQAGKRWRSHWEASIGHSRNPLVQPGAREVVFTLPQGNLALPLEGRPQPGTVAGGRVLAEFADHLLLQAQAQGVENQGVPAVRLGVLWRPWAALPSVGLYAQAQRLADASRRVQAGLQWVHSVAGSAGHPATTALIVQAGAFQESSTQRQGPTARLTALHVANPQWQVTAWAEAEGRQGSQGPPSWAGLGASMEFKPRSHLSFSAQAFDQKDLNGYSPLLENNAPRQLRTLSAQAEWALGAHPQQGWALRLNTGRRLSNLPLFAWKDAGVTLLWRTAGGRGF